MNQSVFKPQKSLWQRCKEDPLVPIGCVVTAGILAFGLITMTRNQQQLSQRVMRARVVAQGVTIALVGIGSLGYTFFMPNKAKPTPPTYN